MNWRTFERLETIWQWMERRRFARWVLTLLAIDLALLVAGYGPLRWMDMRLRADMQAAERDVRATRQALLEWHSALQRVQRAQRTRDDLLYRQFLPEDRGFPTVRDALERMAMQAGLRLQNFTYTHEAVRVPPVQSLSIQFSLTGGYEQIRRFIQSIETAPQFLILESIRLRSSQQGGGVELELALRTFLVRRDGEE
ncbi:MAG: type 4a pilus biogenesis protein PilO [Acidobacteria bacterium]|nr:type 4a pilus biogenesis protein PilO [Acidobacteriota bacterium]MDW7984808.1 type 4a pilus biogenesis protein PilO [Acidobacteriota bacterium]